MVTGNTCTTTDKAVCEETFDLLRKNRSVGGGSLSSALTSPNAKKYVERLLREVPLSLPAVHNEAIDSDGHIQLRRRLAVISGVYVGSPGYYVAEELAVAADMDVVLVGKSPEKLQEAFLAINQEAKKRTRSISSSIGSGRKNTTNAMPKLYQVQMNANSLRSVATAAEEIEQICAGHYHGQLHVSVNLADEVHKAYSTTEEGVEVNVGWNYLAPRLLVDLLLPVLRAAATPDYKPRIVQEASLGHCLGSDFNPCRLRKFPKEGGAPNGTIVRNEATQALEYSKESGTAGLDMYYRSKMALMADTLALAKEEPMLAVVSCDPGMLTYAAAPKSPQSDAALSSSATASPLSPRRSLLSRTDSSGLGLGDLFHLGPSQGARSALRAALDPDFNTTNTMHYLHYDGNPWAMAEPTIGPQFPQGTGERNDYYELDAYAEIVRDVGEEITGQLVVDRDCELVFCLQMQSSELSSTSLLRGSSQHSDKYSHRASSSSSSFLYTSHSSLLGRSYSSLISQ